MGSPGALYTCKDSGHAFILINTIDIIGKVTFFRPFAFLNSLFLIFMKLFKYFFFILYRIWFYLLVLLPILILLPFLLVSILKESWYPNYFKLSRIWARIILFGMSIVPRLQTNCVTLFQCQSSFKNDLVVFCFLALSRPPPPLFHFHACKLTLIFVLYLRCSHL